MRASIIRHEGPPHLRIPHKRHLCNRLRNKWRRYSRSRFQHRISIERVNQAERQRVVPLRSHIVKEYARDDNDESRLMIQQRDYGDKRLSGG
jgi:hypothetical protein